MVLFFRRRRWIVRKNLQVLFLSVRSAAVSYFYELLWLRLRFFNAILCAIAVAAAV